MSRTADDLETNVSDTLVTPSAMQMRLRASALFMAVTIAGVAVDLASKQYVFQKMLSQSWVAEIAHNCREHMPEYFSEDHVLIALNLYYDFGPLRIRPSTNENGTLGLDLPRWAFFAISFSAVVIIVLWFMRSPLRAHGLRISLALLLAGVLGNSYDRLAGEVYMPGGGVIQYQVRDFIDLGLMGVPFVLNLADLMMLIGAAIITWLTCGRLRKRVRRSG